MTTELITRPENANLCLLLGKGFSSPQHFELHLPRVFGEMVTGLPPGLEADGLALAEEWEHAICDVDPVLLAYAKLFIGPFEIQAPPYASHYLEPDQRLMGEVSMWVAKAYSDSNLGPAEGPAEAPDHVALEWEFLYYLGFQATTLKTPEWSKRAEAFICRHMLLWIPRLAEAILASETHPYYQALARFTHPFLQFIGTGNQTATNRSLRSMKKH